MLRKIRFLKAVNIHDEEQRLKRLHEARADAHARSGDSSVFEGQPVEGGFVFIASVVDRYGIQRGGVVSQTTYRNAALRIVENGFEVASAAQIEAWQKENDERAASYLRRQAISESRSIITAPATPQVTPKIQQ